MTKSAPKPLKPPPDCREQLAKRYTLSLARFLSDHSERALREAYEIGRSGVHQGLGVLDMLLLHQAAVEGDARQSVAVDGLASRRKAAWEFLMESLTAHEMAYRGFREANAALLRFNEMLEQHSRRIAHAIHDEAGQLLVGAQLALEGLMKEVPPRAQGSCREISQLLAQVGSELRSFSHELRPILLDERGLVPALKFLAERISKRTSLAVRLKRCPAPPRSTVAKEATVYRVVQEALANVVKHANARNVWIELREKGRELACLIEDDGDGFDVATVLKRAGSRGLGLIGMEEQINMIGGSLQIKSRPGRGTQLSIAVPWDPVRERGPAAGR
ncbi:MAG: sensor histidine kinase [Verrucomicrobiales bacterium]|nr:sensor histidine kinase [Verrucomicrobiales bacterium]